MSVFISYSHTDSDFVDKLAANLVKRKIPIWIDRWELNIGDSLIDKIQTALTEASYLCLVLSKNSVASEWCKKELNSGLIRELDEKRVVILPLLTEDCEIPLFLRDRMYADFRKDFDEAFDQLIVTLSRVFSDKQGRVNGDYLTDWGIDWGTRDGIFEMHIDSISFSKDQSWSVLSNITVRASRKLSQRFKLFNQAGLDWLFKNIILDQCREIAEKRDLRLLITDNKRINDILKIKDKNGRDSEIIVSIRRLGEDTGRDVIFDYGDILIKMADYSINNSRKMTSDEENKLRKIMGLS